MKSQLYLLLMIVMGQIIAVILISIIFNINQVTASPLLQFTPPTKITLGMYALLKRGAKNSLYGDAPNCSATGKTQFIYGCTYYDDGVLGIAGKKAYPFISNTITISIEGHIKNGVQQGYLHNVISQEMTEASPLSSYTAQAIAARTYTYKFQNTIDNNSAQFHVYIPYRYEAVATEGVPVGDRQIKVNNAITASKKIYMSFSNNTEPIWAAYGQDNCPPQCPGLGLGNSYYPETYVTGVADPISEGEVRSQADCLSSGLGQIGTQRLAIGNSDSKATTSSPDFSPLNYLQILTHYYTSVHIKDANNDNAIITPENRWIPLETFIPISMRSRFMCKIAVHILDNRKRGYISSIYVIY